MASLTIRNLEENLKGRLRVRAASRGRSMEEEARQILRAALTESPPGRDFGDRIRRRFAALGDVQLPIAAREPVREPPVVVAEPPRPRTQPAAKAKRPPKARRAG